MLVLTELPLLGFGEANHYSRENILLLVCLVRLHIRGGWTDHSPSQNRSRSLAPSPRVQINRSEARTKHSGTAVTRCLAM